MLLLAELSDRAVVFATAARLRLRPKPHVYACTHLANTASLLLPVSNLTNLLAFRAGGLSFAASAPSWPCWSGPSRPRRSGRCRRDRGG